MGPSFYWPWNDEQSDEYEEDTGDESNVTISSVH